MVELLLLFSVSLISYFFSFIQQLLRRMLGLGFLLLLYLGVDVDDLLLVGLCFELLVGLLHVPQLGRCLMRDLWGQYATICYSLTVQ